MEQWVIEFKGKKQTVEALSLDLAVWKALQREDLPPKGTTLTIWVTRI